MLNPDCGPHHREQILQVLVAQVVVVVDVKHQSFVLHVVCSDWLDSLTFRVLAGSGSSDPEGLSGSATFSEAPALWNLAGTVLQTGLHAGGPSQGLYAPKASRNSRTHTRSNTGADCRNH